MFSSHYTAFAGLKLCIFVVIASLCCCLPDGDLCRWMNGRKYYIDIGESGFISADNVTSLSAVPQRCSVELITCPSCHFLIEIQQMNIPSCSSDQTCRCDFLWMKEVMFGRGGKEFCGFQENSSSALVYESQTKLVSVDFLYSGSYKEAFLLQFYVKPNIYVFQSGFDSLSNNSGVFSSPNFPGGYPTDFSAEYVFENKNPMGLVQIIFSDFQLSLWSFLEVYDSNGTRIKLYNGNTFRPPAILSSGSTLTVKFQENEEYPRLGFRAEYTFLNYVGKYWLNRPSTDCGGPVEDAGGAITMMNLVPSNSIKAFDCVWLIRPRAPNIPRTKIAIRVAQFEEMGLKSTLAIREGQHSSAPLLELVTPYQSDVPRGQEYVALSITGFYIRLIGYFTKKSHLAIIYTAFRYEGCYAASDFECKNRRCISKELECDGFNHCGDGSDEAACHGIDHGTVLPEDASWWRTLTPNYYFPKQDSGSGFGTNTLIVVTSVAGLGMLILTGVMIVMKLNYRRRNAEHNREVLQTISASLDFENSPEHHVPSDLPLYDPPPSYDDVIKLYLPPPPPYTSMNRGRSRPSRKHLNGIDNRAYNNSNQNTTQGKNRSRTSPSQVMSPEVPHSLILKVKLPDENRSESNNNAITYDQVVNASNFNIVNPHMSSILIEEIQKARDLEISGSSSLHIGEVAEKNVLNSDFNLPDESISSPIKIKSFPTRKENGSKLFCECQGACSCKLIREKQSRNEHIASRRETNENSLEPQVKSITKKRSFKEMMQKSISRVTPVVTSQPQMSTRQKSKKAEKNSDKGQSKSAGPSSPTSSFESDDSWTTAKTSYSKSEQGHRRSSSGPSEINDFMDIPSTEHEHSAVGPDINVKNQAICDNGQLSNLNNNTVLCDFLPKSSDKSSPASWNSWMPLNKRLELDECVEKTEHDKWVSNDTLPLLRNGSIQPIIVKLVTDHSSPTQTQSTAKK